MTTLCLFAKLYTSLYILTQILELCQSQVTLRVWYSKKSRDSVFSLRLTGMFLMLLVNHTEIFSLTLKKFLTGSEMATSPFRIELEVI